MLTKPGKNEISLVRARETDIPFVRQLIDLAEHSGTDIFPLQAIFELSPEEVEALMESLMHEPDSYYYWEKFWFLKKEDEIVGGCAIWIEEEGLGKGDMVVTEVIGDLFGWNYLERAMPKLQLLKTIQIEREVGTLQLDSIAILPTYQGRGYVHILLEKTLEYYARGRIHKAQIQLVGTNERAIKAYQKSGFQITLRKQGDEGLKRFYPGNEKILMERLFYSDCHFASK